MNNSVYSTGENTKIKNDKLIPHQIQSNDPGVEFKKISKFRKSMNQKNDNNNTTQDDSVKKISEFSNIERVRELYQDGSYYEGE